MREVVSMGEQPRRMRLMTLKSPQQPDREMVNAVPHKQAKQTGIAPGSL